MSSVTDRAYGSNVFWVWWQGLRDRLRGAHARANARWGYLLPPPGPGRIVWVEAGNDEPGVHLALGALRALRETRIDLRLVLTFEHEFPQLLERGLAGLKKTRFGYGPCDTPRAVRRALRALAPLGVVMTGREPAPNLCTELEKSGTRCIALHAPAARAGHFEAVYPADTRQAQNWRESGRAEYIAPVADLSTLLIEAQVDPNFRQALCGSAALSIWWLLGAPDGEALATWWAASPLSRAGILIVSPADTGFAAAPEWTRLSAWSRTALPAGSIVLADESRWLPAVAASSDAVHIIDTGSWQFWQALAGGCPLSLADRAMATARVNSIAPPQAEELFPEVRSFDELERLWRALHADPIAARSRGDALRRVFWGERRRADDVNRELLQRVFDW